MNENRIFIFEFVSGGGFTQVDIPPSLFCEGYGMLRSIIADFKSVDFEIFTLLDYRIKSLSYYLNADLIKEINARDNFIKKYKESIKECEYCFIIAPEFSRILYELTKIAIDNDKKVLSIGLKGIKMSESKIKTYDFFKDRKVYTPQTHLIPFKNESLDLDFIIREFRKIKHPIIIKPEDGVGAESIYYFENEAQIYNFFNVSISKIEPTRNFILQEYIEGEDLSVSLIGCSESTIQNVNKPIVLSINSQDITIKNSHSGSEYYGGYTPVEEYDEKLKILSKALEKLDLSEFSGYFGIDFIKKHDNTLHFIEINPRLTTSYIGIRNVIDKNPVELILNSNSNYFNPIEINYQNYSIFSRLELQYGGNDPFYGIDNNMISKLMKKVPELITPPIYFDNSNQNSKNGNISCFFATKEKTMEKSRNRVTEIINCFEKYGLNAINKSNLE